MEQENRNQNDSVFSRKIRAGRRRTYFFDVRTTKSNDYYLTITESKKRNDNNGYERHKVFIYKEDFNKFLAELTDVVDYIKSQMPDFDFDSFNHVYDQDGTSNHQDEGDSEVENPEISKLNINESVQENNIPETPNPKDTSENKTDISNDHEDLKW